MPSQTTILKLRCPTCNKIAQETSHTVFPDKDGEKIMSFLECGHYLFRLKAQAVKDDVLAEFAFKDGRTLYPFQTTGVKFIEESNFRCLLADEMGLGKTIQAIAAIYLHPEIQPALIVCRGGQSLQWFKEWYHCTELMAQIISSAKDYFIPNLPCYIIGMDLLRRIPTEKILALGIKTVVIDECQYIKNHDAQRTHYVRKICAGVDHVIPMSGTPFENRASEYFPVLNILHPEIFPSRDGFTRTWVDNYWDGYKFKEGGIAKNKLKQFKEITKEFIIRRTRKEAMPDLPTVNRQMRYVDLDQKFQKAYDEANDALIEFYMSQNEGMGMAKQQELLAMLAKLRHITGLSKVPDCLDFVIEFLESTDRKITVFCHHRTPATMIIEQLKVYCSENNLQAPLQIDASMDNEKRFEVQEKFTNDPNARILIAGTLVAGVGLNLQACSDVVILEREWNPMKEEQAEGRTIRIGQQSDKVNVTYLLAGNTIDEWLTDLAEAKRRNFNNAMAGEELEFNEGTLAMELAGIIAAKGKKQWTLHS